MPAPEALKMDYNSISRLEGIGKHISRQALGVGAAD